MFLISLDFYNIINIMKRYQIILDTNVLLSALRSRRGASFKLLSSVDSDRFEINLSVALMLEYEDVLKREAVLPDFSREAIDNILNYLAMIANKREIFFLWRPYLIDPKDDFILELAVESSCDYIITYNLNDFKGVDRFGVKAITPKEFLKIIGGL